MRLRVEQCQDHLPTGRPPMPPLAWCERSGTVRWWKGITGHGGREPVPNGAKCRQWLCSLGIAQDREQAALVLPGTPRGTLHPTQHTRLPQATQ